MNQNRYVTITAVAGNTVIEQHLIIGNSEGRIESGPHSGWPLQSGADSTKARLIERLRAIHPDLKVSIHYPYVENMGK